MSETPLMPKATAVWLVDNTTLTFRQIAEFCGMHELEVAGIADGEVAQGIKGFDPIANHQLTAEEITRCEGDPVARLRMVKREIAPPQKRKGPRYTPVSKRQDRPAAIAWLVRYHPELEDAQISKLIGTTKPTITSIREKTHWNYSNLQPVDPVALGLCKQTELDAAVKKAAEKRAKLQNVPTPDAAGLMSTEDSLGAQEEDQLPSSIRGLENFTLDGDSRDEGESEDERRYDKDFDPDALFNLPKRGTEDEDDDEK